MQDWTPLAWSEGKSIISGADRRCVCVVSILHQLTSAIRPPGFIDPLITLRGDNYTICKLADGAIDGCVMHRWLALNSFSYKHGAHKICASICFGLCKKCIIRMGELCRRSLQHCSVCVFLLSGSAPSDGCDMNTNGRNPDPLHRQIKV